jgi:hypothetical protein
LFVDQQGRQLPMKNFIIMTAGFLAFAALPVFAAPISFPECPGVGLDAGCELLITVTATNGSGVATAFTVSTSITDPGSYDGGGDGTLIGVLNSAAGGVFSLSFAVAPGTGSLAFDLHGACAETGGVPLYSPAPAAAKCLNGQYWTTDAMDYASANVTFPSLNSNDRADLIVHFGSPLGPGQSAWFSLPGALTASEFSMVAPEPSGLVLIGTGLSGLYFWRRRKSVG